MGAAGPTKRGGSIADINVTPLVDVVLVLLIIFMVVGDLLAEETPESSIPIDLPPAATGDVQPSDEKNSFAVAVDKNGKFIVAGKRLNEEQLAKRVRQEKGQSSRPMEPVTTAEADRKSELASALYLLTQKAIIKHTTLIRG